MVVAERLKERMKKARVSQSELARRIGVTQPTIYRLVHGQAYGSTQLHKIARELGTTPAYLMGEVDDPEADAPPATDLTHEHRQLLDCYDHLDRADQSALLRIAHTMAGRPFVALSVHAPKTTFRREGE